MTNRTRTPAMKHWRPLAALVTVLGLAFGTLGCQAMSSSPSPESIEAPEIDSPPSASDGHGGAPSEDDGILPHGSTVFDAHLPGIANLAPSLLSALHQATEDAAHGGIEIQVTSGWRSAAYQNRLLEQAVGEYGSEEEAARWVATAENSAHVTGEAVDIAPYDAIDWLVRNGAAYGLCQIYGNESWHYELRPEALDSGCPEMYPDPTYDPGMQR